MLTEEGCRARRQRLWNTVPGDIEWIVITEPRHLVWLANFSPSPFVFNSQGASAALILGRDGAAILIADNVQEPFLEPAFASEKLAPLWYRCVESAGHRTELLVSAVLERLQKCSGNSFGYEATACPAALIDGLRPARPGVRWTDVDASIRRLRRTKEADEVAAVRRSLAAATAALVAAMSEFRPGMTEFDAYRLVQRVAGEAAGCHVLVYGDFVSGPRCEKGGGPPSSRAVRAGDLVLLDFSVVIDGYRGDFCNTFACGARATPRQRELYEACFAALQAGERKLRPGTPCREVHEAVRSSFAGRNLAGHFPHHAGHGVGLGHPEAPFIVPESSETLAAGDVVTLEPGLYLPGIAGMRYERNYVITPGGCESLSDHPIAIDAFP
ncbi:MAG: M24 family metallopeptidase [Deltaproteobacteria bacterium]